MKPHLGLVPSEHSITVRSGQRKYRFATYRHEFIALTNGYLGGLIGIPRERKLLRKQFNRVHDIGYEGEDHVGTSDDNDYIGGR
ncbi:hypothetical protein NWFMUON74_21940 [Nocardia wallacei]|uniref:Uncharacterized protein n=1 Tax=Nocardia wallacei TaxID=480035 RepID=A0A7G1KGJ8_9NOCA|nr:hypothetical protein NWFMUON74_21940 [Nocardia wallacei]